MPWTREQSHQSQQNTQTLRAHNTNPGSDLSNSLPQLTTSEQLPYSFATAPPENTFAAGAAAHFGLQPPDKHWLHFHKKVFTTAVPLFFPEARGHTTETEGCISPGPKR